MRRPRAFTLDEVRYEPDELYPSEEAAPAADAAPARPPRRGHWLGLLVAALGGLASLAIGLAIDRLVRDLFARNDWLGWFALGLVALAGLAHAGARCPRDRGTVQRFGASTLSTPAR